MPDERGIVDLAASVADGEAIDWAALEAELGSDSERSVFRQLRVLAELAEVHRSVRDEPDPPEPWRTSSSGSAAAAFPSLAATLACADPPPEADGPSLGHWGPYELTRSLGVGTLGEVVLAHDHLQRNVVIRVLAPAAEAAAEGLAAGGRRRALEDRHGSPSCRTPRNRRIRPPA